MRISIFFLIFLFFFAILFSSHDEHESTSLNTRFLLFLAFSFNNNESRTVFSVITSAPIRLTLFVGFFWRIISVRSWLSIAISRFLAVKLVWSLIAFILSIWLGFLFLFFEINAFESVVSSYKSSNLEIESDDFECWNS